MNKRARIGLIVPALTEGGGVPSVARFVRDVIVQSNAYDLELISLSSRSDDPCSIRLGFPPSWFGSVKSRNGIWEGSPYIHIGAVFSEFEFQRYKPRRKLSEAIADCDILQIVCGSPAVANSVIGLGKPVSIQVATRAVVERKTRDERVRSFRGLWGKAMTMVTDRMDDRALKNADAIQVENDWMLEYARKLGRNKLIDLRYAPPGIDGQHFVPLANRRPLNLPYVLCVGRLNDPRKNIRLLLEAFAEIGTLDSSDIRLVLAGTAAPNNSFWDRANELRVFDKIEFFERPSSAELVRLYQHASVFALSSNEEGLGVVLLEAMACGVPVVSTRSGGPDGVITDGEDGFLVPLGDITALAAGMRSILEDHALNIAMGRNARAKFEKRYEHSVAGKEFLDVWQTLLSNEYPS